MDEKEVGRRKNCGLSAYGEVNLSNPAVLTLIDSNTFSKIACPMINNGFFSPSGILSPYLKAVLQADLYNTHSMGRTLNYLADKFFFSNQLVCLEPTL